MATSLPLLVFPQAKSIPPPKVQPVVIGQPHVPGHGKQAVRLSSQLTAFQQEFDRYKASVSGSVAGLEPETVLVIEIAGSVYMIGRHGAGFTGYWNSECGAVAYSALPKLTPGQKARLVELEKQGTDVTRPQ